MTIAVLLRNALVAAHRNAGVTLADGATIGAGSVISKNAPADQLTVARARQVTIEGWQRPVKKPK